MIEKPVICLMGPTASGKTDVAMQLADSFPIDLISVDSALVYRGMDIGTAKPDPATLGRYPHRLVDIRDPEESYSAGEFVRDASAAIDASHRASRVPLLVGGTMMYFRSLTAGIADLPDADSVIRATIDSEAQRSGWPAMHARLSEVDPVAASRINENDSQRIQRALEVYRASGRTLTEWQADTVVQPAYAYVKTALVPEPRSALHARIALRLDHMLEAGFVEEIRALYDRPGLTAGHASMRAVGYRQFWRFVSGADELAVAREKALAATRQLAKRQLTWLRSETDLFTVNPLESNAFSAISGYLQQKIGQFKN